LAAKFELGCQVETWQPSWQPSSNLADVTEGTRGRYTETKKLGSRSRTWQGLCQVQTWLPSSKLGQKIRNLAGTWQDQMSRMWYCSTISYNGPSTTNKSDRCFSLANSTVPHWWMALKMTQVTTMTTHTPQHTPPPIFVRVSLRGGWCTARPLYGSYYMPPQTNTQNYQLPAHYKQTLSQPPTS
jgi:hypothetical protein